jgi:lysophospholipase L1-like esterase
LPPAIAERNSVNAWLRGEGRRYFDGVIDFDAAVRSPHDSNEIDLPYDAADGLHMNGKGYQALSDGIPQQFLDRISGPTAR